MSSFADTASTDGSWSRRLGIAIAVVAVLIGVGLVLLAVTIGHCSAFGGACDGDAPPLLDDDVFGMSAFGGALAVGAPLLLRRVEARRRLLVAFGGALVAALLVGLLARSIAHG